MIEINGLTKYYGVLGAVVDLTLRIEAGTVFGFIGPNGAGKTTTMRILATLLEPTRGTARIDGLDVGRDGEQVRRRVGYMPDFMGVYDDLKVYEYLEFFAAAFGLPRAKRRSVIDSVLELTDLTIKRAAAVDSLSRGMQQRLGLARVLIHDPKVLILDEPASGLDPRARVEIRELLLELKRMGKTIMISSHILSELELICDQVGIIESGRMVFDGTLAQVRSRAGAAGPRRYHVRVNDDARTRAAELLAALPAVRGVEQAADGLTVTMAGPGGPEGQAGAPGGGDDDGAAPLIARTLVEAGLDLHALIPEQVRLDEAFMQLTQGRVQ
jgi:ABC-2 type transport system ATP-binding protein